MVSEHVDGRIVERTRPNWELCPSTHCERREECCSPSDCTVRTKGRKTLVPAFEAHLEAEYGGKLPPVKWSERYGGLPYYSAIAQRFRDFMAGFEASERASALTAQAQQIEALKGALQQWRCGSCGGSGQYINRSFRGQELLTCKVCEGSGDHPIARAALKGNEP